MEALSTKRAIDADFDDLDDDDGFLRRSKRIKTKPAPHHDGSSDLTPASDIENEVARAFNKGKKKRKGVKQPSPSPKMSPSETISLTRLASSMELGARTNGGGGTQFIGGPNPEARVDELNGGITALLAAVTRVGSTLDQIMGRLGVQGGSRLEDKADAILKHVQSKGV